MADSKSTAALLIALCAVTTLAYPARPAHGQTIATGLVEGVVVDVLGRPLADVLVTLYAGTGRTTVLETDFDGTFRAAFLAVGTYEILAERLGYRPARVMDVRVVGGRSLSLVLRLNEDRAGAATGADTTRAGGAWVRGPLDGALATLSALERLPWGRQDAADVAARASAVATDLGGFGLPAALTVVEMDGLPLLGAQHPTLGPGRARLAAFPSSAVSGVLAGGTDADLERTWGAGGLVTGTTLAGGTSLGATVSIEAVPGALRWPGAFTAAEDAGESFAGLATLTGPIVGDTAQFAMTFGYRRHVSPMAPLASPDLAGTAVVRDALAARYGAAYDAFFTPASRTDEVLHGVARVDFRIAEDHRGFVRVAGARSSGDSDLLGRAGHSSVAVVDGTDVAVASGVTSRLGASVASEVRLGVSTSSRDYDQAGTAPAAPWTSLIAEGVLLGGDADVPGRFRRTTVSLRQSTYAVLGRHALKFGVSADFSSFDIDRTGAGRLAYSDVNALLARTGVFTRWHGAGPADFTARRIRVFAQDRWRPAAALEVLLGVDAARDGLPQDRVVENADWLSLTGLSNADISNPPADIAPRLGLRWLADPGGRIVIEAAVGRYMGEVDAGIIASAVADADGGRVQRVIGAVADWPAVPSASAGTDRPTLTLLNPELRPPRSDRASVGVVVMAAPGLSMSVAGTWAVTRRLPRRSDLNLLPGVAGEDQHGRPLFGRLVQSGGLVVAQPGSNRRFEAFDVVTAVDADGETVYRALTAELAWDARRGAGLYARYTYSRAEDDWLPDAHGVPGFDPLPTAAGGERRRARSTFDAPHRLAIGGELQLPGLPLRIAGTYSFSSGAPFTPGFRPGVDANADGVAGNDPAFVGTAAELGPLMSAWPCLREQAGRLSDRNACREPDVHELNLRVALRFVRIGRAPIELLVDGMDLLQADRALRDHALNLIDPSRSITTDPTTGRTTLPLVVNPDFGRVLLPLTAGRSLRLALQVRTS